MIDLSRNNKKFLPIKLHDGKLLNVYVPTIRMLGDLAHIDTNTTDVKVISEILSKILSNNMQKAKVETEQIDELDFSEIKMLIDGIVAFTNEVANSKN